MKAVGAILYLFFPLNFKANEIHDEEYVRTCEN